jgi:hypothetical protein
LIDLLVTFANSIVQAAGTDFYQRCRRFLGRELSRLGRSRKSIEAKFDVTHERVSRDPSLRTAEVQLWTQELSDLLSKDRVAEHDLELLYGQLTRLMSKGKTRQVGIAGRDQYNIGRDATFIRSDD